MSLDRGYRYDPNYYRLLYQLAAQQLNAAFAVEHDRRQMPLGATTRKAGREIWAREALACSRELIAEARGLVNWFDGREASYAWWKLWGAPKMRPRQLRLHRFLAQTILPCAEIAAAGAQLLLDPEAGEEADSYVAEWRARLIEETDGRVPASRRLSYRALYNLACYEASRGREAMAFAALGYALRRASGERRQTLVRWARNDPSLAPLREDSSHFAELIASFEWPEPEPAKPPDEAKTTTTKTKTMTTTTSEKKTTPVSERTVTETSSRTTTTSDAEPEETATPELAAEPEKDEGGADS
jgi:hypothetical protein